MTNAEQEGLEAYHRGDPLSLNPYDPGDAQFVAWRSGWLAGGRQDTLPDDDAEANNATVSMLVSLVTNAVHKDCRYVVCVETAGGSRICASGGFDCDDSDLAEARMLERFARGKRTASLGDSHDRIA